MISLRFFSVLRGGGYQQRLLSAVVIGVVSIVVIVKASDVGALPRKISLDDTLGSGNPYGWLDDGTVVRLNDISDLVGIGTVSPAGKLHVAGGNAIFGGNVGIGTTTPAQKLHIDGSGVTSLLVSSLDNNPQVILRPGGGAAVDPLIVFQDGTGTVTSGVQGNISALYLSTNGNRPIKFRPGGTDKVVMDPSGNVGIGTPTPTQKLVVSGTGNITSLVESLGGGGATVQASGAASANFILNRGAGSHNMIDFQTAGSSNWLIGNFNSNSPNLADFKIFGYAAGGDVVTIKSDTGNVGIGTTEPLNKLDVAAADNRGISVATGANSIQLTPRNTGQGNSPLIDFINGEPSGKRNIILSTTRGLEFQDVSGDSSWIFRRNSDGAERMRIDDVTGNVGIGTMNPGAMLDVAGNANIGGDVAWTGSLTAGSVPWARLTGVPTFVGGSGTTNYLSKFTGGTSIGSSLVYDNGANVGIGTAAPSSKLHVAGSLNVASTAAFGGNVSWVGSLTGGSVPWARLTGVPTYIGGSGTSGYLAAFTGSTSVGTSPVFSSGGNVGIGTTAPAAKLTVSGGDIGIRNTGTGLILKAYDGLNCYRILVSNGGSLVVSGPVTCP